MGLPQEQESSPPAQSSSSAPTAPASTSTSATTSLPPEALALATQLFNHARSGSTATLQQYLTAGIPPNLTNHAGDTLLMLAAYHGHAETVSTLLDVGADPDVLNDRGQSPVAGAVFKGWSEVVKVLWERGADVAAGKPSAVEAAELFKRDDFMEMFGIQREGPSS